MAAYDILTPAGMSLGDPSEDLGARLARVPTDSGQGVLQQMIGGYHGARCTNAQILAKCERLSMLSRAGCPPGFLHVLPRGVVFDEAVEALNRNHAATLDAAVIRFPLVFERRSEDIASLTETFERQGRSFRLAEPDGDLRLAYAADPALFAWLRGRRLKRSSLPYVLYSPMPVFRRFQSGELSLLNLRQYTLPDLHALCPPSHARQVFATLLSEAAKSTRLLFGEDWTFFVEISPELSERFPDLAADAARVCAQFTHVTYLERRVRYFGVKAGINVSAGSGPVMLFNFQWDETSSRRFDFSTTDGESLVVFHSTLAGGWPKVLPSLVGRALIGWRPCTFPTELAPVQVAVFPVGPAHVQRADEVALELRQLGLRTAVEISGSLSARVRRIRESWTPFQAVVGDRELAGAPLVVTSLSSGQHRAMEEFVHGLGNEMRHARTVAVARMDLPFA